jgi:hypothetical protein
VCDDQTENIYTIAGVKDGNAMVIITHYSDNDNAESKTVEVDLDAKECEVYYLDNEHDPELPYSVESLRFDMKVNTAIMIKER